MKKTFIGLLGCFAFLAACNGPETKANADAEGNTAATSATPRAGAASVDALISDYLQIKNALANDNGKDAASAGLALKGALNNINTSGMKAEQLKTIADIRADATEHAMHIAENAGNIKHQREHFQMLSKDMYDLAKNVGTGQPLYYDHCPMYNNGKGADWLSNSRAISNPYLGKAMPDCGVVKDSLK